MPINLNLRNSSRVPEPEEYESMARAAPSESQEVASKQFLIQRELPRGKEDACINDEAMARFQEISTSYKQSASFKIHTVSQSGDPFIFAITSSQKVFDKWVKMNAEFTQNQIELERQDTRIKDAQEKRKDDFLQEMEEVQEMKKQVMAYYEFLAKK